MLWALPSDGIGYSSRGVDEAIAAEDMVFIVVNTFKNTHWLVADRVSYLCWWVNAFT